MQQAQKLSNIADKSHNENTRFCSSICLDWILFFYLYYSVPGTKRAAALAAHRGCGEIYIEVALIFLHSTSEALTFYIGSRLLFTKSSSVDDRVEFTSLKCTAEVS